MSTEPVGYPDGDEVIDVGWDDISVEQIPVPELDDDESETE